MTSPSRLDWARGFIQQAEFDAEFALGLHHLLTSDLSGVQVGIRPQRCCPAIYAYCQQALEKALKAWLWWATGSIPKTHNPLSAVLKSPKMRDANRPECLGIVDRTRKSLKHILDMAPGSDDGDRSMAALLRLANTEYPFASGRRVKLPHEVITLVEVSAALHFVRPLVRSISKFLEAQGLMPGGGR